MKLFELRSLFLIAFSFFWITNGVQVTAFQDRSDSDKFSTPIKQCWSRRLTDRSSATAGADSRILLVAGRSGILQAVDSNFGKDLWSAELGGEISSEPFVHGDVVYVATNEVRGNGQDPPFSRLRAVSLRTGVTVWGIMMPYSSHVWLDHQGGSLITIGDGGTVAAYSETDGTERWILPLHQAVTAQPAVLGNRIALVGDKYHMNIISGSDGQLLAARKFSFPIAAIALLPEDNLMLADERGNVELYSKLSDSSEWRFKKGARFSALLGTQAGILATSYDNFVYMLATKNGNVIWKRRLPGRIAGAPTVTNDLILIGDSSSGDIFLLDLKNGRVINQVSLSDTDEAISAPLIVGSTGFAAIVADKLNRFSFTDCTSNKKGDREQPPSS
ncbi:MAG: PQQ-binding-like beta-propeller repeat protein [Acidobacteriota bacterium]